jgi:hypothetical protein
MRYVYIKAACDIDSIIFTDILEEITRTIHITGRRAVVIALLRKGLIEVKLPMLKESLYSVPIWGGIKECNKSEVCTLKQNDNEAIFWEHEDTQWLRTTISTFMKEYKDVIN